MAAAGALLAITGMSVDEYLERLDQQPTRTYPADDPLAAYPPEAAKAWNLSLDELETRSAAARLLGICSVMAPEVSQDLIDSQAMAETLGTLDPTAISEHAMIAKLTRQIDLLALIKVDNNNRQLQIHPVVQAIVSGRMSDEETATARRAVHRMLVDAQPRGPSMTRRLGSATGPSGRT